MLAMSGLLLSRRDNDTVQRLAAKINMSLAIHILGRTGRAGSTAARLIVGRHHQAAGGRIVIMSPHDVMIGGT
jgi:hypothetical protein